MNNSSFPTMGESIPKHVLNMSRGSRYTSVLVKKTMGRGSSPTGRTGKKGNSLIHDANGPRCCIKETLYSQNAAEASASQRNVKTIPSAIRGQFWSKRQYGQKV